MHLHLSLTLHCGVQKRDRWHTSDFSLQKTLSRIVTVEPFVTVPLASLFHSILSERRRRNANPLYSDASEHVYSRCHQFSADGCLSVTSERRRRNANTLHITTSKRRRRYANQLYGVTSEHVYSRCQQFSADGCLSVRGATPTHSTVSPVSTSSTGTSTRDVGIQHERMSNNAMVMTTHCNTHRTQLGTA